jgi:hypothetical protein
LKSIIIYIINSFGGQKNISDVCFICQYSTNDTKYIECCPAELVVILPYSHKTVCDNRHINLYSYSVFRISPEGRDPEMLLYLPKKKFHLPALFVQQSNVFRFDDKVVGQECERSLKIGSIVNYPPLHEGILFPGLIASKIYCLIKQDVILSVQKLFSINNFIHKMRLLSDDKVGANSVDCIPPCKVIISLAKNVECIWLIRNLIHCIHIVTFCFSDMNVSRYLYYNVKQRVNFDTTLVFSEVCPLEQAQAKVYRGGIECINFSVQFERPVNSLALSKIDHVKGKLFKYLVVLVHIGVGKIAQFNFSITKSEMVSLIFDRINDTRDFPETVTGSQLPIHHYKQLVPAGESLHPFVSLMSLENHIKNSFGQEAHELTEYIFVTVHICLIYLQAAKMENEFKSTRDFFAHKKLYINNLKRFGNKSFGHS